MPVGDEQVNGGLPLKLRMEGMAEVLVPDGHL